MRLLTIPATLVCLLLVVPPRITAQEPDNRLRVTLVTDEAEAVLAILDARAQGAAPEAATWDRLFTSEGYRRLKAREAEMRRAFTDDEFRAFVLADSLLARAPELRCTLRAWRTADVGAAARRAFAYLPEGAVIRATVYPVIKPRSNSFVYDLEGEPAIFLYLDPDLGPAKFENTVAHELHHIGLAGACPDEDEELPPGVRNARGWTLGLGEGFAMLAAAGGPDVHPHATSGREERAVWERDVANVAEDFPRIEAFLLDLAEERLVDEAEIRERGIGLIVSEGVPQGPFYTVGWHVAVTVEREFGRERLLAALCHPVTLLLDYNRAARRANGRGEDLPLWSEELIRALSSGSK